MIDTTNKSLVAMQGEGVVIMNPRARLLADDALNLAAWLVTLAEMHASHSFAEVLAAVQGT